METKQAIRNFIVEELHWDGDSDLLTDQYRLIDNRIIDSLGIFQLVSWLEERFNIEIADDELLPEKFQTIETINELLASKL